MKSVNSSLKIGSQAKEKASIIKFSTKQLSNSPKSMQNSLKNQQKHDQNNSSSAAIFNCSICSETFEFKSQQIIHEMGHKTKVKCQVCWKKIYKENVKEHMKIHLENKSYICNFCDRKFAAKHLLMFHLRSQHMKTKAYYCNECGRGFNDSRHFKNHLITHIDSKPFKCDLCPKAYTRKQLLEFHMIGAHQTERILKCSLCSFETLNFQELAKHRTGHLENFKCNICQKEFKDKRKLVSHHKAEHVEKNKHQCLVCENTYTSHKFMTNHLKKVHNYDMKECSRLVPISSLSIKKRVPSQKIEKQEKEPICLVASEPKEQPVALENRTTQNQPSKEQNHALEKNSELLSDIKIEPECVDIDIQETGVPTTSQKAESIKKEDEAESSLPITPYEPRMSFSAIRFIGNQNFFCKTCPNIFPNRSSLMLHEPKCTMKNNEEKSLICKFCDKKFNDQFSLEVHVNVRHVNVKYHHCKQCDFKTTKYYTFRNHRLTHKNLVKCEKCENQFPNEKLMLEHAKDAHIEPSIEFKCETCGISFKSNVFLQRHVKTNHEISKFDCSYCDKSFETRNELNQHVGSLWKIKKCSSFIKPELEIE